MMRYKKGSYGSDEIDIGCWKCDRVVDLSKRMGALDGYYILTRLKYWRKYGMWKSKINGFVDIEPIDHEYLKAAVWIFGHGDIGLLMPKAWENSVVWDTGKTRDYIKGNWGGHSVPLLGYYISKKRGLVYYAATWGRIVEITASAIRTYCDEAYVSIVQDWFAKDNYTPNGFDAEQLEKDLKALD